MKSLLKFALVLLVAPIFVQMGPHSKLFAWTAVLPSFSKTFLPNTIGPGSTTRLVFTITNSDPVTPASDLAFTDTLPAGVTIQTPADLDNQCGGIASAPDGGTTISLSGGMVGTNSSCTLSVNVTASMSGAYMNVSGDLTSNHGNSGSASATLTVDETRPGFSKSFSPSTIPSGGTSQLVFLIDNSANEGSATSLSFTDTLPANLVIATPSNASTDCGGVFLTLTADPGASSIFFNSATVGGFSTCTVSVDVTPLTTGLFLNTSNELTSGSLDVSSGFAVATLNVPVNFLVKSFTNDPVAPGGTVNLQFTITNLNRDDPATNIAFTDDIDNTLTGLVAIDTPLVDPCGPGSALTGTDLLSLTGGSLPAEGFCTFSVTLQVPGGATPGTNPNTTSAVTADIGGEMFVGNMAIDNLVVQPLPLLTKSFTDDPVAAGQSVNLEFTIQNTSQVDSATGIAFSDNLSQTVGGLQADMLPADGFCGMGSSISQTGGEPNSLVMSGGNLAAGASCTFSVSLLVAEGTPNGVYPNTTSPVTATVGMTQLAGHPATDDLTVVAAPRLLKEFTDDPVLAGDTVTLEFTLTHGVDAPTAATGISFSDDLNAALAGLTAVGLPQNDICGMGSSISGGTNLTFMGGTLDPDSSCTFSVTLQVPASAAAGDHTNTTSTVSAVVGGQAATALAAEDDLTIAALVLTKSFTDDPVIPGGTVTLEFTIDNVGADDATNIFFQDDLDAVLTSLTATGLPLNDICGMGSSLTGSSGNTFLTLSGGNLTAGTSCTFSVTLQVPGGAASDTYANSTTGYSAIIGGNFVILPNATDLLVVSADQLLFSKSFTNDPVAPGDSVNLEFTITNLDPAQAISAIAFTDNLNAALTGLAATGLPTTVCGGGTLSGTSTISLTGGSLAAGASCIFSVTVSVPINAPLGSVATNTTSQITGTLGGLGVTGDPASDNLLIESVLFIKSFDGPSVAGGAPVLTFTIQNLDTMNGVSDLAFNDNLNGSLTGLVATTTPIANPCGAGSTLSGTGFLTFSGGNLPASGMCTFNVPLQVPAGAAPGSYFNTTSDLTVSGLMVASPATATLSVEPPPAFSKAFSPAFIGVGFDSTLTFSIDNSGSALAASGLGFTDNLPAGVVVAGTAPPMPTCTGGTLTAVPGSSVITYSGGSVGAFSSCLVQVNVTGTIPGSFLNTSGDLTSSSGNSGTASDTLTVNPQPLFSKEFQTPAIAIGATSNLLFIINNSSSTVAAAALDFTDNLPAAVSVASPSNASTTCLGGTLTAVSGSSVISYTGGTVPAGMSCTVSVDTTSSTAGSHVNMSGALTSSLGSSGTATDTLTVAPVPAFSKEFDPSLIPAGGTSQLTFIIDNSGSPLAASMLDFTDTLPAALSLATPANAATTCTGGTLTAADGGSVVSYSGGSVNAGVSCEVTVDVTGAIGGIHVNTSGDLTSSLGNSGTAMASLTVVDDSLVLTKDFIESPAPAAVTDPGGIAAGAAANGILPGGSVQLEYTLTNATSLDLTNIGFSDDLNSVIPGLAATGLPIAACGGTVSGGGVVSLTGGSLLAGESCMFSVTVVVPGNAPLGTVTSTSGMVSGMTAAGGVVSAPGASANLTIIFFDFMKEFSGVATAGGTIDLTFTITNPDLINGATGINFTDDLNAVIPGLVALGLPENNVCGAGSQVSGTSTIALSGGNLAPGGSCTFTVDLRLPATAPDGGFTNITSVLEAMVGSSTIVGPPASAAQALITVGPTQIPTLSEWGMILMASLLALFGWRRLQLNHRPDGKA